MQLANVKIEVELIVAGETDEEIKDNAVRVLNALLRKATGNWFDVNAYSARIVNKTEVTDG